MSTQPDQPIPADLLPALLEACREMQIELGLHRPKRVPTAVATINHQEPEMNTTTQIPAPTVTDFMWSELLCGAQGRGTADGLCQG